MVEASIVIPSFNRKESVCALVSALIAQHEPDDCTEVIVVLDGSVDGSEEALGRLAAPPGLRLLIRSQPNKGRAAARNAGAEGIWHDRSEFLLNGDTMPADEDAQYEIYRGMREGMAPSPVTVRTIDVD